MIIAILMFNVSNSLGSARFLKTVKCRHRNGYMVIKIFIKSDPGLTLRNYRRRLKSQCILTLLFGRSNPIADMIVEREALADIANIYSYQTFVETEKAGYIIRQWIASNLYDRIRYVSLMSLLSYHS
jgi:phosphoinositide-3-kinase regulatory subunit 4